MAYTRTRIEFRGRFDNIDLHTIELYLEELMVAQHPRAYLIFDDVTSRRRWGKAERFVQFARNAESDEPVLTCHFPKASWSEPYLTRLKTALDWRRYHYSEVPGRPGEPVTGFIVIDGLGVKAARELVDVIFRDVFGCATVRARVWGQGVAGIQVP